MTEYIKKLIDDYIISTRGKLYAPIPHPYFSGIESVHDNRSDVIINCVKNDISSLKTGIDIGSHWGHMCYELENCGIEMTAVESYKGAYDVLTFLKEDSGRDFKTIHGDIFSFSEINYDIILALNIFHHFIKTEKKFNNLKELLSRINCKIMFFQSHNTKETQMVGSYKNFNNDEFVDFILENSNLSKSECILQGRRPIYKIT